MVPPVPVLDTGYPPGGEGSGEGTVRSVAGDGGSGGMAPLAGTSTKGGAAEDGGRGIDVAPSESCFYVDIQARYGNDSYDDAIRTGAHLYDIRYAGVLGATEEDESLDKSPRCFNCGDKDHKVPDCPEPRNLELIALSRQLYEFYRETPTMTLKRFAEIERSKFQRVCWLEEFRPGEIRGDLLRDALGLKGNDPGEYAQWLSKIADWGYPPGWFGPIDPKSRVCEMILGGSSGETDTDDEAEHERFTIFGDSQDNEVLSLPALLRSRKTPEPNGPQKCSERKDDSDSDTLSEGEIREFPEEVRTHPLRRWATYPDTYFISAHLPVYNGRRLPALLPTFVRGYGTTMLANTFMSDLPPLPHWQPPPPPPDLPPPPPLGPPPPPPPMTPPPLPPLDIAPHKPPPGPLLLPVNPSLRHQLPPRSLPPPSSQKRTPGNDSDMELSD